MAEPTGFSLSSAKMLSSAARESIASNQAEQAGRYSGASSPKLDQLDFRVYLEEAALLTATSLWCLDHCLDVTQPQLVTHCHCDIGGTDPHLAHFAAHFGAHHDS